MKEPALPSLSSSSSTNPSVLAGGPFSIMLLIVGTVLLTAIVEEALDARSSLSQFSPPKFPGQAHGSIVLVQ